MESQTLSVLETALLRHDWFYEHSDDFGVWQSGQQAEDFLKRKMTKSPFTWKDIFQAFTTPEGPKRAEILEWAHNNG